MVRDLWKVPEVQETLTETARIFFQSDDITINLFFALLGLFGLRKSLSRRTDHSLPSSYPTVLLLL